MAKDPLEGKTLKVILSELVLAYGWEYLGDQLRVKCFIFEPTMESSLKFLRRTPWARAKVEKFYLAHLEHIGQSN